MWFFFLKKIHLETLDSKYTQKMRDQDNNDK